MGPAIRREYWLGRGNSRLLLLLIKRLTCPIKTLHGQFIEITTDQLPDLGADFVGVAYRDLTRYPFPKFMITYLQEKNVNLSQH